MQRKLIVIALCSLSASFSYAVEVYRWVDENGKVHFSDAAHKSLHEQKAKQTVEAEAVELPPINSADPSDSFSEVYSQQKEAEQKEKREAALAQRQAQLERQRLQKHCAKWLAEYNAYGNRNNTITYMAHENGKPFTEKEQQRELEKMRQQLVSLGCL